jgi:hypothetical protein
LAITQAYGAGARVAVALPATNLGEVEETTTTAPAPAPPAAPPTQTTSTIVFGCVSAAMAIWLLPYVFGPVGLIFGVVALMRGDRRGRWVIAAALLGVVLGLIVSIVPDHILFSGS